MFLNDTEWCSTRLSILKTWWLLLEVQSACDSPFPVSTVSPRGQQVQEEDVPPVLYVPSSHEVHPPFSGSACCPASHLPENKNSFQIYSSCPAASFPCIEYRDQPIMISTVEDGCHDQPVLLKKKTIPNVYNKNTLTVISKINAVFILSSERYHLDIPA